MVALEGGGTTFPSYVNGGIGDRWQPTVAGGSGDAIG